MVEPIELRAEDLVKRPPPGGATGATGATGAGAKSTIGQIQNGIKSLNETLKLLQQLSGGNLDTIFPGLGKLGGLLGAKQDKAATKELALPQGGEKAQFTLFLQLLKMKYGDITCKELIDRLKSEYGDTKLSKLLPGE